MAMFDDLSSLSKEELKERLKLCEEVSIRPSFCLKEDHGLYSSVDPSYAVSRGLKILTTLFAWT